MNNFSKEDRAAGQEARRKAIAEEKLNGPSRTSPKWLRFRLAQIAMREGVSEKLEVMAINALVKLEENDKKYRLAMHGKRKKAAVSESPEVKKPTVTSGLAQRIAAKNPQTTLEQ